MSQHSSATTNRYTYKYTTVFVDRFGTIISSTVCGKTSQLLVQNSKQIIKKAVFLNMESHVQLTKYKTQNYTFTFSLSIKYVFLAMQYMDFENHTNKMCVCTNI